MSKQQFQTEVSQLLQLIVHSLYSHPEIFLRELISNSSDALDKLRHLTLADDKYKALVGNGIDSPRIDLELDEEKKTLTISDTGIGMNEEDLVSHLGTIARSGTKNFLAQLSGDAKKDSNLIGQFGVGFYSVFMVADKVEVFSRKAGEEKTYKWTSDGKTGFEIEEATGDDARNRRRNHRPHPLQRRGRAVRQQLASAGDRQEVLQPHRLPHLPHLRQERVERREEGVHQDPRHRAGQRRQRHVAAPQVRAHRRGLQGVLQVHHRRLGRPALLVPHPRRRHARVHHPLLHSRQGPLDLYQADYKGGIKLYVKRVFIMDDSKELLPQYLRFVRGIIDSEDLPLNVSREILQQNKVLTSIKTASVKKILSELKTIAANDKNKYAQFIAEYNRPLKEGLYGDYANRETLLDLVRFKSTKVEGLTSLAEAKERMQPEQKALYYITGGSESMLRNSPLLEIYKKKGIEVLILDDDIDEIVFSTVPKYGDIDLKAVNKSTTGDDLKDDSTPEKAEELKPLLEKIKATLGEAVKEVRASSRLADSPSVIVSDEDEPRARMRQMMQAMGQKNLPELQPTLEINPDHEIIRKLLADPSNSKVEDAAWLLFDQALLLEGVPLKDPATFVQRLNRVLNQSI